MKYILVYSSDISLPMLTVTMARNKVHLSTYSVMISECIFIRKLLRKIKYSHGVISIVGKVPKTESNNCARTPILFPLRYVIVDGICKSFISFLLLGNAPSNRKKGISCALFLACGFAFSIC